MKRLILIVIAAISLCATGTSSALIRPPKAIGPYIGSDHLKRPWISPWIAIANSETDDDDLDGDEEEGIEIGGDGLSAEDIPLIIHPGQIQPNPCGPGREVCGDEGDGRILCMDNICIVVAPHYGPRVPVVDPAPEVEQLPEQVFDPGTQYTDGSPLPDHPPYEIVNCWEPEYQNTEQCY